MVLCFTLAADLFFVQSKVSYYLDRVYATIADIPDKGKTEFSIYVPEDTDIVDPSSLGILSIYNVDDLQEEAVKQLNDGSYTIREYDKHDDLINSVDGSYLGGAILDWRYVESTAYEYRDLGDWAGSGNASAKNNDKINSLKKLKTVTFEIDNYNGDLTPYTGELKDKAIVIALSITDKWNYAETGPDDFTARTFDNKALIINPNTRQIFLITFPRDALVMTTINGNNGREVLTKTSLFGLGVWTEAIESLLGCPVDFTVRLEMTDLIPLIDAMGGVTVDNPHGFPSKTVNVMQEGELKPYETVFATGEITLSGTEAYVYAMETEELVNGENGRTEHLINILTSFVGKFADYKYLFTNRDSIVAALEGLVTSNIEPDQIIRFAWDEITNSKGEWTIKAYTFTGYDSADQCLSVYGQFVKGYRIHFSQQDRFEETVQKILNNEVIND